MQRKLSLVLVLCALLTLTALTGAGAQDTFRVGFVPPALTSPFHVAMVEGAQARADELGWELVVQAPASEGDFQAFVTTVEQLLETDVDAISINPIGTDSAVTAVRAANERGVPILAHNFITPFEDEDVEVAAYIGYDQWGGAEALAAETCNLIASKYGTTADVTEGKVYILLGIESIFSRRRTGGFLAGLEKNCPNVEVVGQQTAEWLRTRGQEVAAVALQQTPDIDVFYGNSDEMAIGAALAAEQLGLVINEDFFAVGIDGNQPTLDLLAEGQFSATLGVDPFRMGVTVIDTMARIFEGEELSQQIILTPSVVVTPENLEAYLAGDLWTEPVAGFPELDNDLPTVPEEEAMVEPGSMGRIVFIPKSTDVSYWLWVKAGVEDRAAELGYSTDYQGVPREIDIAQQADLVRNVAATRPAGIVMAATDAEALVVPVEEAIAAGVPVVMVDSGINSDAPYAYIATDNLGAAAEGARILAELIGGSGKVGNLGILAGSQTGSERDQGFLDEMAANYPDIEVLPTQFTGCDPARALNAATDLLTANPDIVGFYSACGPNGLGIAQAVIALGLQDQVKIVTFDPNPEVIPLFENGTITAMIAQNPYAMGVQGVDAIHAILTGQEIPERNVLVPVTIITMENYETPEVQALVTPPN